MTRLRRWALFTCAASVLLLCACALTVYVLDPYAHYHVHSLPLTDNPGYAAPGIARSYDYDTVLLGSSMVENTKPTQIDRLLGGTSVKIPMRGGTSADHARVLDACYRAQPLRRVIYCLDPTSFQSKPGETAHEYPAYLWNGAGADDIKYLLNVAVLLDKTTRARRYARIFADVPDSRDAMYLWMDVTFSRENALGSYDWHAPRAEMKPADVFADRFFVNYSDNVERFVAAHPETEFVFYFPPYSVIYWILQSDVGNLEAQLWIRAQLTQALLAHENVKIFDFAAYTPWILTLERYMDYSHHDPAMNAQIIEAIAAGTLQVTDAAQLEAANDVLRDAVRAFVRP